MAELQASDARFRIALMIARTAVYEHDRELRVRWQYNVPVGDVVLGKTDEDLFPADLAEQLTALKRHVLETGEPFRGELKLTRVQSRRRRAPRLIAQRVAVPQGEHDEIASR